MFKNMDSLATYAKSAEGLLCPADQNALPHFGHHLLHEVYVFQVERVG